MVRTKIIMCAVVGACCGTLLTAQSTTTDKGKMDKMDKKGETVMVTGCVAEEMGHYTLTNAMMSGDSMASKSQPLPSSSAGTTGSMGMTYGLMGGDLKAHVGHKVEVTGMMDSTMKNGSMTTDKSKEKDKPMAGSANAMKGMLTVTAVKMISSSCP